MYLNKSRFLLRFVGYVLLAVFAVMIFAPQSAAATATAGTQAVRAAQSQAAENRGSGLRSISSPRTQPQTFTGLPAGVLPGDTAGAEADEEVPAAKVALVGDPLLPIIGPEKIGTRLDHLSGIAAHVGYTLVKLGYSPTVMDTPYSFALLSGNRRVSTLFFNRSMVLMAIQ